MRHFIIFSTVVSALAITGCATVTDSIPTVKVVRKKPKTVATVMNIYEQASPKIQRAEAPMVCDNANMRERASDNNSKNDTARVLILEDNARSNTVLADVTVNCKDYFESRGQWARAPQAPAPVFTAAKPEPQIVPAAYNTRYQRDQSHQPSQPRAIAASSVRNIATNQRMYRIRTGDTLYRIARNNCTDAETLADMNDIYDASRIAPGQMIRLPRGCN